MKLWIIFLFFLPASAIAKCHRANIMGLHPTQMDAGFREVVDKLDKIKDKSPKKLEEYIEKNPAPVVTGPGQQLYIFDRHHLALALHEAGINEMCVDFNGDLSNLKPADFWQEMERRNWVYLFDNQDQPVTPDQLPADVMSLQDDPYRSLVWQVREQKGFKKTDIPFAEFQWAHFFRSRVAIESSDADFDAAVARALVLAHSEEAKNLPGWTP